MHKKESRLFVQHVAVDRRYRDSVLTQSLNYWIDLAANQDKISCDSCFAAASGLKVNCVGDTHCRRNFRAAVGDFFGAGNAELINTAVYFTARSDDLIDLLRINANVLSWRCGY